MPPFAAQDPDFEASVRRSFDSLTLMGTVGARLQSVRAGAVEIDLPFRSDLTQHHGYMAAAVLTAIVDVACGYAAMTLMPPGASVLTNEYKVNFLSPVAQGDRMVARGKVVRPGRTVTICSGDVVAISGGEEKLVATMLTTMVTVPAQLHRANSSTAEEGRGPAHSRGAARDRRRWCICRSSALRRFHRIVPVGAAGSAGR